MSNYAFEGPKWSSSVVTWSFAPSGGDFTGQISGAYQDVVRAAVARWAQVSNLTLQEVSDSSATNVRVGWGSFSGSQIGETDYSYTVGGTQTFVNGVEVRLEDPSLLAVGSSLGSTYAGTQTTLYEAALHEFGHSLGMDHSTDPNATMYPYLSAANGNLDSSDIAGIQALYGTANAASTTTAPTVTPLAVALPNPVTLASGEIAVYRFFDKTHGTQFLTGDVTERNTLIQTRPDLTYEGLGMAGVESDGDDPNAAPVFRFFDSRTGTHLFTTSTTERAAINSTRPDLVEEGSSFSEHITQQAGDVPVFRFFEKTDGSHFYTTNAGEKATLIAGRPDMAYEGVAFYAPATS